MLDRIDIHVEVPTVQYKEIAGGANGEASDAIRDRVEKARQMQRARFSDRGKTTCNARMKPREIKAHCQIDEAGHELLRMAMTELGLSARAYDRILKVSRTIADLDAQESIQVQHLSEAIQYRTLDRNLWM